MPATDLEQAVREAIVTILNAHAGLETVMGRGTGLVVERGAIGQGTTLPIVAYEFLEYAEGQGAMTVLFSAVASGADSGAKCRAMLEQIEAALTQPAFEAQSLDLLPLAGVRTSVDETSDVRGHFAIREGDPLRQQADWQLPLLYLP